MKLRTATVLLCFILIGSLIAGAAETAPVVTSYQIRASLDTNQHTLSGSQIVGYVNDSNAPIQEITFALIANWGAEPNPYIHPALLDAQYTIGFDPTWTVIHSVTDADGKPISYHLAPAPPALQTFSLDNGLLRVNLPAPLSPGEQTQIVIEFETRFANARLMDNVVNDGVYIWRFGWNPKAIPSDSVIEEQFVLPAANYHIELTVPEDYVVAAGADHHTILDPVDGTRTHILESDRPTRSTPLVIGRDLEVHTSFAGEIEIETVFLPGAEGPARLAASYAADSLAFFAEYFGPFNYRRLVIVENPAPGFFGMAADGMILVGSSFYRLKDMPVLGMYDRLLDYLVAHEVAHLWWGIGIGADFNAENWISEGFAEFLTFTYFEERYGAFEPNLFAHIGHGLVEDIVRDLVGWFNMRQHHAEAAYLNLLRNRFDEAIVKPMSDVEFLNGQIARIYSKGYLVLRALESLLGRETMFEVLREAHTRYDTRILTVSAFHDLAEQVSGTDLDEFFAGWVHGDARFDVAISGLETIESDTGYSTHLYLSGFDPIFPIVIEATLDDGSTMRMEVSPGGSPEDVPSFETTLPITSIAIDPDEMLPDGNRFNNHWPRRILVTHPFQFEEVPAIGMPLDAYVLEITTSGISGRFRNDHVWSLTVLPHIDPEMDWETFDIEEFGTKLDIVGMFGANIGRSLSVSFMGMVTALDPVAGTGTLDVSLSARVLGFTHPEIGFAGQVWYPSWQHMLTFGVIGELPTPIPYLALSVTRDDILTMYMRNMLTLQLGIPGFGTELFGTIEWQGNKRLRLAHLFYADVAVSIAETLTSELPTQFLFWLDELYTFDHLPMGHHQMFAALRMAFPPLIRNSGYAIFNLTRLDSITPAVFIQGGRTLANCDIVCEPGTRLEVGGSLSFTFPVFLGAAIRIEIGYAHPLVGVDGAGRMFMDLGGSF